ncbi:hypothetical protein BH11CYA1_BH11CYA1_14910 [soil metagenome]
MAIANGLASRMPASTEGQTKKVDPKLAYSRKNVSGVAAGIDSRVNSVVRLITTRDIAAIRKVQIAFLNQKKEASTFVWSSVAMVLAVRLLFPLGVLPMVGIIIVAAFFARKKYRSLCQCPVCDVSLIPGNNTWRTPVLGFSTVECPRCAAPLAIPESQKRMRIQ